MISKSEKKREIGKWSEVFEDEKLDQILQGENKVSPPAEEKKALSWFWRWQLEQKFQFAIMKLLMLGADIDECCMNQLTSLLL